MFNVYNWYEDCMVCGRDGLGLLVSEFSAGPGTLAAEGSAPGFGGVRGRGLPAPAVPAALVGRHRVFGARERHRSRAGRGASRAPHAAPRALGPTPPRMPHAPLGRSRSPLSVQGPRPVAFRR